MLVGGFSEYWAKSFNIDVKIVSNMLNFLSYVLECYQILINVKATYGEHPWFVVGTIVESSRPKTVQGTN